MRLRRLRNSDAIRDLVSENRILAKNLIMPYFVTEGKNKKESIASMPGIYRLSIDNLIKDIRQAMDLGIKAMLLFGVCHKKDALGSEAFSKAGIVQKALKAIKKDIKDIVIFTDVCLCGYTSHGHCGIVKNHPSTEFISSEVERLGTGKYVIDNDETIKILTKIALSHAESGADFVAPSAMMDGQVKAIRETLDSNGFKDVGILSYSAKYASGFYGPFRDVLDSAPQFGNRKAYQLDYRNRDEALREIAQDINEGADIVMVKPALAYLDIVYRAKQNFNIPIAAYNVSGEYSMIKNISAEDKAKEKELALEVLTCIKRSGADIIITYWAKDVARWLKN